MMDRITLLEKFKTTRKLTEELCQSLEIEDYVAQPVEHVSPTKWHLAHTSWFFENFILKQEAAYQVYNPSFSYLFNSYYEHEGERWSRVKRGDLTRPTVREVLKYRKYVTDQTAFLLERINDHQFNQVYPTIELGINHEQQHQELLITDIKYVLCHNPLNPVFNSNASTYLKIAQNSTEQSVEYLPLKDGIYEIGHDGNDFCFDNELHKHKVYINPIAIRSTTVTNAEYLEFMLDGGYLDFRYWLMEGWEWVKSNQIKAPLYWGLENGEWHESTLNGFQKIVLEAPITHINYYEAEAFATWAGKRLPTESEWEVFAQQYANDVGKGNFLDDNYFHPIPSQGNQLLGNVWEFTSSSYSPYPNFKIAEGAIGEYNGKFMMNQMVLRGGSCATAQNHIRTTYRNFFHPDKRWQFTGIRLAQDL